MTLACYRATRLLDGWISDLEILFDILVVLLNVIRWHVAIRQSPQDRVDPNTEDGGGFSDAPPVWLYNTADSALFAVQNAYVLPVQ